MLHAGYEALFDRHANAEVLLLGSTFVEDFPVLGKEIRALTPERAVAYLTATRTVPHVRIIERTDLPAALTATTLVVVDDEIGRALVAQHRLAAGRQLILERVFLRWDREWSTTQRPADYDGAVTDDPTTQRLISQALGEAARSSDWWRQVGAVAVRDDIILAQSHNEHRPTEYTPYLNGDPRNDFSRGVRTDLSTAIHAEALLIAHAARDGLALAGADLYVSTFPCPSCARLVAEAGLRRLYFAGPYAVLDGDAVLAAAGVERIWVDLSDATGLPDGNSA